MNRPLALIIDDEPDIRELLEITLARMGIESRAAGSVKEALARLVEASYGLCLVDMRLPDGSGIDIVRHVAAEHPDTPIAVITAHGNMETAVEALKAGAFDFVSKPVDLPVLRRLVDEVVVLFDGDEAGRKAAFRSLDVFLAEGFPARAVFAAVPGYSAPRNSRSSFSRSRDTSRAPAPYTAG